MSLYSPNVVIDGGNPNAVKVDGSAITQPVSGSVSVSNLPVTQPVSGSVSVANFPATQPVSGTVSISGTVSTTAGAASTATITRVATSASSVSLLAANASRKRLIITTEVGAANYIALAATASITAYTYLLGASATLDLSSYTGPISLIRASGSGSVQVTELV